MTRVLVVSTLFPNREQPNHGVFVENRLRHVLALGDVEARVVAPVPYFPSRSSIWGRYAGFARVPANEQRSGVPIWHPRYIVVPKIGTILGPPSLYRAFRRSARQIAAQGFSPEIIDAHYFYPDGVAAALLARELGLPFVITGRGSDLTLLPKNPIVRRQILWAAQAADALVTVSDSLKTVLCELGGEARKVAVLRNGVETDLFVPMERDKARAALGVEGFSLLCVGALIARKGVDIAIAAMPALPGCTLLIAGSGPLRSELEQQAERLGVRSRVRFLGEIAHRELPQLYNAADAMLLMSDREGWANVILESLACGTPVVATDVGGAGEIIRSPSAGRLLRERSAAALAREVESLRASMPDRAATRRYAEGFGWRPVALANRALLQAAAQHQLPTDIAGTFSVLGPDT